MSKYFTKSEAENKLWTKVISLVEFSGVPNGTMGIVTDTYKASKKEYGVSIRWVRYPGDKLEDGFSKDDYEQFLKEVI